MITEHINLVIDRACRHGYCSPDRWPSTTSAMLLTMNFSLKLSDCQTTSCMHYYRHHQPHHNVMTLDNASTHSSCLNTLHTYRTVTFSCTCYMKTNTRTTQL